ncbi:MAG: GDSL-type esterase/lipase family protein [Stenotrophobium sp.]
MNAVAADIRVCFVGDSFVAGVGDPEHRGWTGRVCARAAADGHALTSYNLGIRHETSADIAARWQPECARRLRQGEHRHIVFSFGVNDTVMASDATRIAPEDSLKNLRSILGMAARDYNIAMVGPPPVADDELNLRIDVLSRQFGEICKELRVPYLPVFDALNAKNSIWIRQAAANDGAHPRAQAYAALAQLVQDWPQWWFR